MNTLDITKEKALTAYEHAKPSGKKLLEDLFGKSIFQKKVIERIKNFDDVLQENGIDKAEFYDLQKVLTPDEFAYKQIKLIAKTLNEGWLPDWKNGKSDKYYPWFVMGSPSGGGFSLDDYDCWYTGSAVGSRLCFKSSELAKYAGTTFLEIYKSFMTLNN